MTSREAPALKSFTRVKGAIGPIVRKTAPLLALIMVGCATAASAKSTFPLRQAHPDLILGRATRFDYESIDPRRQLLFVSHLGSGKVVVVNLRTDKVAAKIPDVPYAHGVLAVPELGEAFASATGVDKLDVISERTFKVIASVPAGDHPDGIAYAANVKKVFISDEFGGSETVVDARTNRRVATIPMGGHVGNSQYDPVTGLIYADVQTRNQVVAINPRTDRIVARYDLPNRICEHDHGLLIDGLARRAFVACSASAAGGNPELLMLDMKGMRVLYHHSIGRDPDVLAFDPGLGRLYVGSESGAVSVFQLKKGRLRLLGWKFLAFEAHSVAADPITHLVYFPLQDVHGRGVLRIMRPAGKGSRN